MKKILLSILILFMFKSGFSQTGTSIHVINNSSCDVYFMLLLSNPNVNPCGSPVVFSDVIMISANSDIMYTNTTYPTYSMANSAFTIFFGARIFTATPTALCGASPTIRGCAGASSSAMTWTDNSCNVCSSTGNAMWVDPTFPSTEAKLIFD